MNTWKCVFPFIGFTIGKVYNEDRNRCLIDNDGDIRLPAKSYKGTFVKVVKTLENK